MTLNRKIGYFAILSFLIYLIALCVVPYAYPGYHWLSQAVSDLGALSAPSYSLWTQFASMYFTTGLIALTCLSLSLNASLPQRLKRGINCFVFMQWLNFIGYTWFPLTEPYYPTTTQDLIHGYVVTPIIVLLTLVSFALIISSTYQKKETQGLFRFTLFSLFVMIIGALGVNLAPASLFGFFERFSIVAVMAYQAFLGWLWVKEKI